MFIHVQDIHEVESQLESSSSRWILFKHSDTCPISRSALTELEIFDKTHSSVPIYYLEVKSQRDISNWIEQTFDIQHESPQACIFK